MRKKSTIRSYTKKGSYELGSHLFGKYGNGKKSFSTIYKKVLKAKFNLKYAKNN